MGPKPPQHPWQRDGRSNEATISEDPLKPVSLAAARACIKRTIKEGAPSQPRVAAVYSKLSQRKAQEAIKTREDAITLARLRSGHHAAFGAYRNLMDPSVDPMCRRCVDDRDTVEHWLDCPGTAAARFGLFGSTVTNLDILTEEPALAMALAVKTLR